MSSSVEVRTSSASYEVAIGTSVIDSLGPRVAELLSSRRFAVITDETVAELHAAGVLDSLRDQGRQADLITIPAGESNKSWAQAGRVLERLAELGLDRTDAIVAVGGGVVGDLAGFCAGVYLRGIDFIQVPTTLLAQVDSSVGGKTGVDLDAGKNLAGVFVQPRLVIADVGTLATLSEREWASGLAEVAKSAILDGERFMGWMEANAAALVRRDEVATAEAVSASVAFKAGVVGRDEHESGPRESLNLGHTLGHAIEKVAGYGAVPHGIAVAEGVRFAARLAEVTQGVAPEFAVRQRALLDSLGLEPITGAFDPDAIRSAMSSDKKARGGRPRFVLATAPGSFVVTQVDEDLLAEEIESWATRTRGK